ncbi:hypothetical protein K4039_23745 [Lyngbya sp. CCAP 1446/10]|uniref:hypothetical protein n=1 Tax=Microcoleaceae TaxID=1892252 RepID=UPI002237FE2A|nr:hypothetical protein [Lyngbya sp. CCAP 1446/10]MCW6053002.1 hypothetical protein [Lyngbya sp. CCAP 1446/10]
MSHRDSGFEWCLGDRMDVRSIAGDSRRGIASLHREAKKLIEKTASNGINETHLNLILLSNLIIYS